MIMADGGIQKKPGGAGKLENYSTDNGQFVSDGSTASSTENQQTQTPTSSGTGPFKSYYESIAGDASASIKIKLALLRLRNSQGILSQDSYEKKRGQSPVLNEQQVLSEIPNAISDAIVQKARANNFNYMYLDANGRPHTDYGTSEFLTNEVAKERWVPIGLIPRARFDQKEKEIRNNRLYFGNDEGFLHSGPVSQVPYGLTYRGIGIGDEKALKKIFDGYVGGTEPDLLITMGARGEGIYTSPRRSVADSYAENGYHSHVIRMIIDRKNANMATYEDVNRIQSYLIANIDKVKQSVVDKFKGKLSDEEAGKMGDLVANNIKYDPHFGALIAGYDAIQDGYLLLLNGRCVYTERETFDENHPN